MDAVEQFKYKKLRISIFPDEDSQNPYKEWDNLSDTNFWLRGYDLDSAGKGQLGFDSPQEVVEAYERGEIVFYAPIYTYIHSGITISMEDRTYPFNDPWDSGLAGMVYVTKEKAAEEFPRYRGRMLWLACERVARSEIQTLDMYLTNQVYGYVISTKKGKELDSCWGCYGLEYCIQQAKEAADYCAQQRAAIKAQKKLAPFSESAQLLESNYA